MNWNSWDCIRGRKVAAVRVIKMDFVRKVKISVAFLALRNGSEYEEWKWDNSLRF